MLKKPCLMMKKTILTTLLTFAITPMPGFADALESVASSDKLIQIRPAGSRQNQAQNLRVTLTTEKNAYAVGETIRFKIRSNKRIFLYLFNVDPTNGKALAILPNRLQTNRAVKYPGDNQSRIVPNPELEFFSDRPGTERIIMVASESYLDVGKLKSFGHTKSTDDFFAIDTPLDAIDAVINDAYNKGASQEKRVHIRRSGSSSPRLPNGVVIQEVSLRIR